MISDAPWRHGVAALSAAFAAGQLDTVALLETCLARVARLDPRLNAVVTLDPGGARAAARASAARWRAGAPLSLLDGVPITIKDNLLVGGLRATWGSLLFADHHPGADERPVARLRAAGMVILGKTNVPELTLEGYTANRLFGATGNPWDPRLTPGGSSGGAAASVAAAFVPAALGTDGGGSIRRPASHTGLVGFKPSIGRVVRGGGFPATLHDFEVVGTLTRSVADAILLDGVLAETAAPPPPGSGPAPRRRILCVPRLGDAPLDPEIAAATEVTARRLGEAGHMVETGPLPLDVEAMNDIWHRVSRAGVAAVARTVPADRFRTLAGPSMQAMADEGRALGAAGASDGLARLGELRRRTAALFERVDLVFMPSAAALPWPAAEAFPPRIDGKPVGPRGHAVYTGWVNVAGHPAIALPIGTSRRGLPIGGQFVADFGRDAALLAFARWFETSCGPPWQWPPLAEE